MLTCVTKKVSASLHHLHLYRYIHTTLPTMSIPSSIPPPTAAEENALGLSRLRSDINVCSWNVLAQCYFDNTNHDGHVKDEGSLLWPARCKRLIQEMITTDADVLCLQEVQFAHFDSDYAPELAKVGYEGLVQADKKRASAHPQGVATFWKADTFKLDGAVHRSRTMAAMLTDSAGRTAAIVNCHLEGNPRNPLARVKQLQTTLTEVSTKYQHHALVVCGDFNCALGASASAAYLSFGQVPPGIVEWGVPVDDAVTEIPRHNYSLASSYEVQPDVPRGFRFTYCGTPDFPVDGLDQVWYTPDALRCTATRQLHASNEARLRMIRSGLPSPDCPSDHIAVGAAFNWMADAAVDGDGTATSAILPNLQATSGAGAGAGAGGSGGGAAAAVETAAEHIAAAEELLAACPFSSTQQRAEFELVTAASAAPQTKGKPSPEQIAMMKEMRARKDALLASVDDPVRQMLLEILRRRKVAKKLQQQQKGGGAGGGQGNPGKPNQKQKIKKKKQEQKEK